jgi:hypothetical protein
VGKLIHKFTDTALICRQAAVSPEILRGASAVVLKPVSPMLSALTLKMRPYSAVDTVIHEMDG